MELRHYETTLLFSLDLEKPKQDKIIQDYIDLVTKEGGKLMHKHILAQRKLAYPIQKKQHGYYQVIEWLLPGKMITTLELLFKRNEHVWRFLTVCLPEEGILLRQEQRKQQAAAIANKKS